MVEQAILAIMGSGETSPTMTKLHRELFDATGGPGVVIDTPVGFQSNATEISARALDYFKKSVQRPLEVASFRNKETVPALERERALNALRNARYVFAGPGSPTYALRHWADTPIPSILRDKLRGGGCVAFSSAAALTTGRFTIPVYEIYKVGEPPTWRQGLDLTAELGLKTVVIPHYNNAEGGTHDTRYCYLGEERLSVLEQDLDDETFILGVDEHTACVLDGIAGTARVTGIGKVTLRKHGIETVVDAGTTMSLTELVERAGGRGSPRQADRRASEPEREEAMGSFSDKTAALAADYDNALAVRDLAAATNALLELEDHLWEWRDETFGTDEYDVARRRFRAMMTKLAGEVGRAPHHTTTVEPLVDALVAQRERARREGRYGEADELRAALVAAGVEIRDSPEGTRWLLSSER